MKSFKFLNNDNIGIINLNDYWETRNDTFTLQNRGELVYMFRPTDIHNCEFCFQFDDAEPIVFANGSNQLHLTLEPSIDANIIFNDNGRTFKLFARERQ